VELVKLAESLGFHEAWIGEHHSTGHQLIASPELFLAYLASQTSRIRLGTGVVSLPYHHPLWVADRMVQLDHLTHGRVMMGCGPGALPSDAHMIGMEVAELRPALEQSLDAIVHLLRSDEPLTVETPWFKLRDARLQLKPYSDPCFEIGVAAIKSPSGPRLAGKHGLALMSLGPPDAVAAHWPAAVERADEFGNTMHRSAWRVLGYVHLAETREQAMQDVAFGLDAWFDHQQRVGQAPQFAPGVQTLEERLEWIQQIGVIGTPDDAIERIENVQRETGGFGCYMVTQNGWANHAATRHSLELFAEYVMPRFTDALTPMAASEQWCRDNRDVLAAQHTQAVTAFSNQHAAV
jgi:limonene 1,2-monooxygenase